MHAPAGLSGIQLASEPAQLHPSLLRQVAPLSTSKGPGKGEPHRFFYPEGAADVGVVAYGTSAAATGQLAKLVAGESAKAIAAKGSFTIALTGAALLRSLRSEGAAGLALRPTLPSPSLPRLGPLISSSIPHQVLIFALTACVCLP